MAEGMGGAIIHGVPETQAALRAMEKRVDLATRSALKKTQTIAKRSVKAGMRGRPRWDKRGPSGRGGSVPAVNLNLNPHHVSKGGGPGSLTGHLRSAVGGVKKPKKTEGGWSGGVGCGGQKSVTNLYRFDIEGRYPYMKPGVAKAKPKFPAVYKAAWGRATR